MTTTDDTRGGDFLAAGTRLGEFEIEQVLGRGGFGVTYLAYDHSLDRRVAIKEYLPQDWGARGPDGVGPLSAARAKDYEWGLERFLKEARALARLHHAHIVQVYQVFEAWGTAYMVTEYVKGGSLAEALGEGSWTEARVLALLDALTAGLAAVHEAGLVHRDVKPANVMLREDGSPVLIDFGAVRSAAGGRTGSLLPVMTPKYAPIEQYTEKGVLGPWTDVYALGAVAYKALSGREPDEAPERASEDTLRPVAEVASQAVSARLSSAVASALAVGRQDRPQSMAEWRALLGLPPVTGPEKPPPPPPPPPPQPEPSRWLRLAGAAAVAAVVLAVAGLAWWAGRAGAPETAGTVTRAPVGENAVGATDGAGGGRGGSEAVSGRADTAVVAPGAELRNGSDSSPAATETGSAPEDVAPEDSAPDVAPEVVEEALGLDRAGWRRIQEGLAALGLDPGAPDGLVGGGTRRAVRAYQEGAGKPATGFLDAADMAALRDAASEAERVAEQRADEAERLAEEAERQRLAELRRPGRVFRDCDGCPEMVVIPAGEFMMGSPVSEEGRDDDEGPQHRVTVRSFALGVTEVTFDEWEACVRGGGCDGYRPDDAGWGRGARPVIYVNWDDARAYVSWLSRETGESYRLPSEAEWEYAARGGTTTPFYTGTTISTGQANYSIDRGQTTPVRTFAPNPFGLYDVHGNVWEWVEDCWNGSYRGAPADGSPWGAGDCGRRVLRGGSWLGYPRHLRSAARDGFTAGNRYSRAGFRVARTLD